MAHSFTCPHCGATTQVADEFMGLEGRCINCGGAIKTGAPVLPSGGTSFRPATRAPTHRLFFILGAVAVVTLLGYVVVRSFRGELFDVEQEQCKSRLLQLGTALESYNADYGKYPPAYVVDSSGKRIQSWRALLMPYPGNEAQETYDKYDFTQPWNSPNNAEVGRQMPLALSCPVDPGVGLAQTSFLALVDPATGAMGLTSPELQKALPGRGKIGALMFEASESGIHWLEPLDAGPGENDSRLRELSLRGRLCYHTRQANVLLTDGTVEALDEDVVRSLWRGTPCPMPSVGLPVLIPKTKRKGTSASKTSPKAVPGPAPTTPAPPTRKSQIAPGSPGGSKPAQAKPTPPKPSSILPPTDLH